MSQTARIVWMANRVRCMPFAEFGYRLRQAALGQLEQRALQREHQGHGGIEVGARDRSQNCNQHDEDGAHGDVGP